MVDCDHIDCNSSKIISLPDIFVLRSRNMTGLFQKEQPKFGPKLTHPLSIWSSEIRSQIAAEWLQIAQQSQWRAYRKPPSLLQMVPSLTPCDLPFSPKWGSICPKIREWPYFRNGWSDTLHDWLGLGFQGRWIEWRYFWLRQIQDGGRRPSWIISNGHISATAYSIHFMFGSRVWFSGSADRMALFPVHPLTRCWQRK